MYLSFIWVWRVKKTYSFGDKATNWEPNSTRYVRFFLHFFKLAFIRGFSFAKNRQKIVVFRVQIGGRAFI